MNDELKERVKLPLHPVTCSVEGWSTDEARVLREFAQAVARECANVCDERGTKFRSESPFAAECHGLAQTIRVRYGIAD